MSRRMPIFFLLFVFFFTTWRISEAAPTKQIPVPKEYRKLYIQLSTEIDKNLHLLALRWNKKKTSTAFCTSLMVANANRGASLLKPSALKGTIATLDSLKIFGIKGVTLEIGYPLLVPSFPRSEDYLKFYKRVAIEVKKRKMVLVVKACLLFTDPDVSQLDVNYKGLTMDRYKREKREMVKLIIKELKPDYLSFENEPSVQTKLTGMDFSVENYISVVNYILKDLPPIRGENRFRCRLMG